LRIGIISRELPPHGGGIGSWSSKAARGLARLGHEVHLFTEAHGDGPVDHGVDGVQVHRLRPPRLRPHSIAWAWAAAHAVRKTGRFDVIQACEWDAEAILYALRPRAPLVTRLATPHYLVQAINEAPRAQRLRSALTSRLERAQARRSRRVISPTHALAARVASKWRLDEGSIAVVPTGIDPPRLSGTRIPDFLVEVPYILYFGRLEIRKGVDVLIDALPSVLSDHPDMHCVLIGEDLTMHGVAFADYARERCPQHSDRIHFLPRMPHAELFEIVAHARVVAIPSRWENLANTCLEAMVLERAVITTSGSGFDEVLTDGVNGLLVPPGDSAALATALHQVLADPRLAERLGAAARRRAEDFTVDRMAANLVRVYESAVD
jgi:glycogen synthase